MTELSRASYLSRSLTNPFAAYAMGFCIALAVYSLRYSDLYPPLDSSLIWFLLSTCAVCGLLAFTAGSVEHTITREVESITRHAIIAMVIMAVFGAEIVYSGGIPLLLISMGGDFNYQEFGIPTVHVAFFGFAYFYAVYWFDIYLVERRRSFLTLSALATSTSLIMFSRGAFIITLVALVFVYVQRRGISRRLLQSFAVLVAGTLWGFGYLGDIRTHGASGESIILSIGEASDSFRNSSIPTELFWPYLYISSPLANLQLNISDRVRDDAPATYAALELLPDFVSKRIVSDDIIDSSWPALIVDELAVTTMYGRSFVLLGWLGMLLSFSYFLVISLSCLRILKLSKYFTATCGILSSLALLNIFDHMFTFAGGIMQILVALFLHLFERTSRSALAPALLYPSHSNGPQNHQPVGKSSPAAS